MPSDPNIILGIKPPPAPPDPLSMIGQLANIRNANADVALRNAQMQTQQANTADIQQQTASRNRVNQSWSQAADILKDPTEAAKYGRGDLSSFQTAGIDPSVVDQLQKNQIALAASVSAKRTSDFDFAQKQLAGIGEGIKNLKLYAADNPGADLPSAYAQWRNTATSALKLDPATLPASITQASDLDPIALRTNVYQGVHDQVQKDKENAQKIQTDKAAAAKDTGQGNEAQAAADLSNFKLNLMKNATPDGLAQSVDGIIDPVRYPQQNAQAKQLGALALKYGGPEAAQNAVKDVYGQVAAVQQQALTTPGDVNKAVQIENATSPAKIAQQVAAARALRAGDNPAVAGVPPNAVQPTIEAATKLDQGYDQAKQAADEMNSFISLARSGNKTAYAYAPTTGVLTINAASGTKRVNLNEIKAYGGAGSDWDKIQGFLGSHLTGAGTDLSVLGDMQGVNQALAQTQYTKYKGALDSLNARSGAKFQPTYPDPGAAPALPVRLSASDVGKTFINKEGSPIKVTAVNPSDATQFKWEPASK